MDRITLKSFYDRLCFALTNYEAVGENEDACDLEYDNGAQLYNEIVEIVNEIALVEGF